MPKSFEGFPVDFRRCLAALAVGLICCPALTLSAMAGDQMPTDPPQFYQWATTPPMGWNSWDCFGAAVTEAQVRANADYMAQNLKQHGWQFIVVYIQWYERLG